MAGNLTFLSSPRWAENSIENKTVTKETELKGLIVNLLHIESFQLGLAIKRHFGMCKRLRTSI